MKVGLHARLLPDFFTPNLVHITTQAAKLVSTLCIWAWIATRMTNSCNGCRAFSLRDEFRVTYVIIAFRLLWFFQVQDHHACRLDILFASMRIIMVVLPGNYIRRSCGPSYSKTPIVLFTSTHAHDYPRSP